MKKFNKDKYLKKLKYKRILQNYSKYFYISIPCILCLILSIYFINPTIKTQYINEKSYPVEMSDFILQYFEENNIDIKSVRLYNEYNYGSYLIFRGIPVFIDSRADLYTPEFNGDKDRDIFTDFMNISTLGQYYEELFEKYGITDVLTYKSSKLNMLISRNEEYKVLYQDDYFVIYNRTVND